MNRWLRVLSLFVLGGCASAPVKYTMLGHYTESPRSKQVPVEVYVAPQHPKRPFVEVARIFVDPDRLPASWGPSSNPADVIALCQEKARHIGADAILVTIEREPYAEGSAYSDANIGVASSESLYRNSYQVTAIRWETR